MEYRRRNLRRQNGADDGAGAGGGGGGGGRASDSDANDSDDDDDGEIAGFRFGNRSRSAQLNRILAIFLIPLDNN